MESQNNNVYIPTSTGGNMTGGLTPQTPYPNVCPGCGRCRDCGQPTPAPAPYNPWPPYLPPQLPYVLYMPITCGTDGTLPASGLGVVALNSNNSDIK